MDNSKETKRNMNIPKKNPEKKTAATSAQAPTEAPAGNASAAGKGANRGEGILNAEEGKKNPKDGPSAERGENRGSGVLKAAETDASGDIFRTGREDGAERVLTNVKEDKNSDCVAETGKDEGKAVCDSETGDNGNDAKRVWDAEKKGKKAGKIPREKGAPCAFPFSADAALTCTRKYARTRRTGRERCRE